MRRVGLGVSLAIASAGCAPSSSPVASAPVASPSASSAQGELETLRTRGTLVVAIRAEAPPANRAMGDPAHAQKRAFESAVATLVALKVIGPNAKVELRSVGGDRVTALDQGADIAMTVDSAATRDRALASVPYAVNAIVLAAKSGGPVKVVDDIRGASVAVAMDELGARDVAQAYLQERAIAATLDTYMGVSGAATAVDAGRASALIGDKIGVAIIATDRSLTIVSMLAQRPYVIAVRRSAPELAKAVSDALRAVLASGEIKDAAAKASFPYEAP